MRWMGMLGMLGCQAGSVGYEVGALDTGALDEEALTEDWAGATLEVISPEPGAWLEWEADARFEAVVYDADGSPTDFDDIVWSTSLDADWRLTGAMQDDATLEPGVHTITATATVPGGHQLTYALGGVQVQSVYAGTYAGDIVVDAVYDAYQASCIGAAVVIIDDRGESAVGDADCLISLMGFELDLVYDLDLSNDAGEVDGDASAEIMGFPVPMDFGGTVSREGELSGAFGGEVFGGFSVTGELDVVRISRDTSGY